MTIFILSLEDYNEFEIIGVYAFLERAEAAKAVFAVNYPNIETALLHITEHKLIN